MKYLGKVSDPKDLATKEYVDGKVNGVDVSTKQNRTDLLTEDNDFITGAPESCKVPYYSGEADDNYSCSLSSLLTSAIAGQTGTGTGFLKATNGVVSKVASIGTSDITDSAIDGNKIADSAVSTTAIAEKAVTASKLGTDVDYSAIGLVSNQVRGIYVGTETPSNTIGNNGDIYIKYAI